jgi:hypothetical protein
LLFKLSKSFQHNFIELNPEVVVIDLVDGFGGGLHNVVLNVFLCAPNVVPNIVPYILNPMDKNTKQSRKGQHTTTRNIKFVTFVFFVVVVKAVKTQNHHWADF